MDIAALSSALAQGNIREEAGILILKKAMETAQQNAAAAVQAQSAQAITRLSLPHLGRTIDISA